MSQPLTSTLLLRGGHRWACTAADGAAILAYLSGPQSDPQSDPHKMFTLRGADGQTLAVPAREIVGVVGETPQSAHFTPMRKETALGGSPYILIDDFLDKAAFDQVLNFALSQEEVYAAATVTDTASDYRRAKVLFDVSPVQPLFVPRIEAMTSLVFAQFGMLPVTIKTIECQLTAHGEGDYFKRHNDNGSPETAGRALSYVYYFNREPRGFSGGHLRMYETVVANGFYTAGAASKDIEPRCNSLIIFPSYCHHEVTPVKCPTGAFVDRRFTVNGWVVRST